MLTYDFFDDMFELRNMVDNFFRDVPSRGRGREYPYIDLYEGKDAVEIRAVVPGVKAEDLNIELVNNSILISGEKKSDYADQPYIRKERYFGNFQKSVKLPYRVDGNSIKAELNNGILVITMDKSEEAKPRKIEIH